jgi:hypothetical protein
MDGRRRGRAYNLVLEVYSGASHPAQAALISTSTKRRRTREIRHTVDSLIERVVQLGRSRPLSALLPQYPKLLNQHVATCTFHRLDAWHSAHLLGTQDRLPFRLALLDWVVRHLVRFARRSSKERER